MPKPSSEEIERRRVQKRISSGGRTNEAEEAEAADVHIQIASDTHFARNAFVFQINRLRTHPTLEVDHSFIHSFIHLCFGNLIEHACLNPHLDLSRYDNT